MGANAGGANVGGVAAREQGVLIAANANTTFSVAGGEGNNTDFTVPAGKKWVIKTFATTVNTFSGTLSSTSFRIIAGGTIAISTTSGSSTSVIFTLSQPLTLSEGQKAEFRLISSAWTSGQLTCQLLYQEMDA